MYIIIMYDCYARIWMLYVSWHTWSVSNAIITHHNHCITLSTIYYRYYTNPPIVDCRVVSSNCWVLVCLSKGEHCANGGRAAGIAMTVIGIIDFHMIS
jgi:hypothetical protein